MGSFSYRSVVVSRMVVPFSLLIFWSKPMSRVEFSSSRLDVGFVEDRGLKIGHFWLLFVVFCVCWWFMVIWMLSWGNWVHV